MLAQKYITLQCTYYWYTALESLVTLFTTGSLFYVLAIVRHFPPLLRRERGRSDQCGLH
jgi:hypothetical protein